MTIVNPAECHQCVHAFAIAGEYMKLGARNISDDASPATAGRVASGAAGLDEGGACPGGRETAGVAKLRCRLPTCWPAS